VSDKPRKSKAPGAHRQTRKFTMLKGHRNSPNQTSFRTKRGRDSLILNC
jgi:hypothetical protein